MKEKGKEINQDMPLEQNNDKHPQEELSEVDKLNQRISDLEKSLEVSKDMLLRKAAEFENYKRRMENDISIISKFATEALILELLPILDDFTRSLKSGKDRREFGTFYQGIELIYTKLIKFLNSQGVKPMDVVGKDFNVDFHDALMQVPKEGVAPHTILEEVEKGYMLKDKVLRHAKVIVACEPQSVPANPSDTVKE